MSFESLENQYYEALFEASYESRYGEPEEEPTRWYLDWESESGDCADMETIEAGTAEEAAEIFREEMVGENGIPMDAVVMAIEKVA